MVWLPLLALFVSGFECRLQAQTGHPEVLVVYNAKEPDSLAVANHYMAVRNVPSANLCAIAPPNNSAIDSPSLYTTYIKTPVQSCLNTVGKDRILYIVMSYLTPYHMYGSGPPGGNGSIDSFLADIWDQVVSQPFLIVPPVQPYYADEQNQGNVYVPFVPFASYRAGAGAALIYSVWRLDGPTAAIASALVDQAVQAEGNGGPHGQACIDRRYGDITPQPDSSYNTGDWDLRQAAAFLQQAGIAVTEDSNFEEFGSAPAAATCPNTAFYTGWYAFNSYNDAFMWQPGSIGWHLDSSSAANPRGGTNWSANALARGIAVTTGAVSEPYLEGMVHPAGAWRNLLEGANVGDAFLRNTPWIKWEILNIGDPLYRPFGSGRAPFHPALPASSFAIDSRELVGGNSAVGTITLSAPAPAGGTTFSLATNGATTPTIPASATVPAGATRATFPIGTATVTDTAAAVITATAPSLTLRNTIIADPLLGILLPEAISAISGQSVLVHLLLNGVAPAGGAAVTLESDSAGASVPATVTVPAGSDSTIFNVPAGPADAGLSAKITAKYAGATADFTLSVRPAIAAISLTPASVNAGGQTVLEVDLPAPAPSGGASVLLATSDAASLPVPAAMTIVAGGTVGKATLTAGAGSAGKSITVTARYSGTAAKSVLTVAGGGSTPAALRINAGGPAYTDPAGQTWSADIGFSGGATWSVSRTVANTSTPALYQSCRWGAFTYSAAEPNGNYTVKLKFAEISMTSPGQRQFNVAINGAPVLSNFDIFAQAGGAMIALDKSFPVSVAGGQIRIAFTYGSANAPMVNAIEIVPGGSAPPAFTPTRVNAGGASFVDSQGQTWSADSGYSGGATWSVTDAIANTTAQALYQTCRWGAFTYSAAEPNGNYTLKLKFAEISMTGPGQRRFNVSINGAQVLSNFDVFAQAGGAMIALDKSFPVTVTGGQIAIAFTYGAANAPMVSAIEIVQGTSAPPAAPIRVNAGGPSYTDPAGLVWSADTGFSGGAVWSVTNAIANTASTVYQTCRYWSSFVYTFAVPNGSYTVTLKFAEPTFTSAGMRVFNVAINGTAVLTNFDIYAQAGALAAVDRSFPVAVTNGQVAVQFSQGPANWPMVNGIEIR